MSVSKVYFTDMRCKVGTSLLEKLDKLMIAAGIGEIDFENKFVAIKLHFGEPGNLSFLRPNFAKAVADRVKALGGFFARKRPLCREHCVLPCLFRRGRGDVRIAHAPAQGSGRQAGKRGAPPAPCILFPETAAGRPPASFSFLRGLCIPS